MKTAVVIGGAGFLGTHICNRLHESQWKVLSVGRGTNRLNFIEHEEVTLPNDRLLAIIDEHRPSLCVHCAGRASVALSVTDPFGDFQANSVLTAAVLDTIRRFQPECVFLTISSASVYGNPERLPIREEDSLAPVSSYGYHKYIEELLCREYATLHGIRTASLRVFSAYGRGLQRQVVWDVATKAANVNSGQIVLRGTGSESRDFIHAQDVAQAVELIVKKAPLQGEAYNIATGVEVPIRQLARELLELAGSKAELCFDGISPSGYAHRWHADTLRLQQLGFRNEVSFADGLAEVIASVRTHAAQK